MRKAVAFIAVGMLLGSQAVQAQSPDQAEWKPVAERSKLTFVDANGKESWFKILGVKGFGIARESDTGAKTEDFALQVVLSESRSETIDSSYQEKAGELWPLAVGKKTSFYHRGISNGNSWQVSDSAKVTGIEDVTVPAGTFKTFVITNAMDNSPWFDGKRTCWYAPEVGYCVKNHFKSNSRTGGASDVTIELKSIEKL